MLEGRAAGWVKTGAEKAEVMVEGTEKVGSGVGVMVTVEAKVMGEVDSEAEDWALVAVGMAEEAVAMGDEEAEADVEAAAWVKVAVDMAEEATVMVDGEAEAGAPVAAGLVEEAKEKAEVDSEAVVGMMAEVGMAEEATVMADGEAEGGVMAEVGMAEEEEVMAMEVDEEEEARVIATRKS